MQPNPVFCSLIASFAALVLITGCSSAAEVPSTPSPETEQTAESPDPIPSPTEAEVPQCSDDFVLHMRLGRHLTPSTETEAELEAANPQLDFEPEGLLEGLEVLCVVSYFDALDSPDGTAVRMSVAIVDGPLPEADHIVDWATAHGYAPTGGGEYPELHLPETSDGLAPGKIVWYPYGYVHLAEGAMENASDQLGFELDADDFFIGPFNIDQE